jgi:hypothetical protein
MQTRVIPFSELQAARRGRLRVKQSIQRLREVAAPDSTSGPHRVRRFTCEAATLSFREGALLPEAFVLTIRDHEEETQVSWKRHSGLFLRTSRRLSAAACKYDELEVVVDKFTRLAKCIDPWVSEAVKHVLLQPQQPPVTVPAQRQASHDASRCG